MLFDMSIAQLLSFIEVRTARELRQHEEAERRAKAAQQDGDRFSGARPDHDYTREAPAVSDIAKVFGNMAG